MIRLVVTAEDFGVSEPSDQRTLEAHRRGIVTSVSLLGNCDELAQAVASLKEVPGLGVGLSLALIGGRPTLPTADVPSLVRPSGAFRTSSVDFAVDWWSGAIAPAEIERELAAQIMRAQAAGLTIEHLATVGHLGLLPGVSTIVERLAKRFGIAGLRTAVEPPGLGWVAEPQRGLETAVLAGLSWLTRRKLGTLRHGPVTWGYVESGRLDEVRILEIIGRLAAGSHELLCHPGSSDGDGELQALTSTKVKKAIVDRGIVLGRWRDQF
jgi:predicted glycoside hydrolase/deacetylase ChbG (UPF0249 family)